MELNPFTAYRLAARLCKLLRETPQSWTEVIACWRGFMNI